MPDARGALGLEPKGAVALRPPELQYLAPQQILSVGVLWQLSWVLRVPFGPPRPSAYLRSKWVTLCASKHFNP